MKKLFITFVFLFIGLINIHAQTIEVKFSDCVDGDTAKFFYEGEEITTRFLAIDTPETVHPNKDTEIFGKDASDYTCSKLKNAKKIQIEYDKGSDKKDKYERHLVWVFVDGELLQKKLISKGYASVAYLYGDYKYTKELETAEQTAKEQKIGIWSTDQKDEITNNVGNEEQQEIVKDESVQKRDCKEIIMLVGIVIILCIFSTKTRNKVKRKVKKEIKKRLK